MKILVENGRLWKYFMSLLVDFFFFLMNGFDLFIYMVVIVCVRGKKEIIEVFKLFIEELEDNMKIGKFFFRGEEKYRIMMEGIFCWLYIGYKMKILVKFGVNMIGSVYLYVWVL